MQVVGGTERKGEVLLVEHRHHDDRRRAQLGVGPERAQHRPTVHPRHGHVEQDRAGPQCPCPLQALAAVFRGRDSETLLFEEARQQVPRRRVVVDDEDTVSRGRILLVRRAGIGAGELHRQGQREGAARSLAARHHDGAAEELGEGSGDREAEAGAAEAAGRGGVGLGEALEQPADLLGVHADSGIADREVQDRVRVACHRKADAAVLGELRRVAQEIDQALAQLGHIGMRRADILGDRQVEGVALLGDQALDGGGDLGHHLGHRKVLRVDLDALGLDLGQVEDVVDQPEKMARVRFDLLHVGDQRRFAEVLEFLLQHLGIADHRRERRAQLVAHVGQELTLGPVRVFGGLTSRLHGGLRRLALGDVGVGPHPFAQTAILGEERHGAHRHVAERAVGAAQAVLGLVGLERRHRCLPGASGVFLVVHMDCIEEAVSGIGRIVLAGEARPGHLSRMQIALRGRRPDDRRTGLDQRAEALLAAPHALLDDPAQGLIQNDDTHAFDRRRDLRRRAPQGVEAHREPADAAGGGGRRNGHRHVGRDQTFVERRGELRPEDLVQVRQHRPDRRADVGAEAALAHHRQRPVHVPDLQVAVEEAEADGCVGEHPVEQARHPHRLPSPDERQPGQKDDRDDRGGGRQDGEQ